MVEGSLAGQKGAYGCPIALKLYGTIDPVERESLKNRMKRDYLPVDSLDQRESEATKRKSEEIKRKAKEPRRAQAAQREEMKRLRAATGGSCQQREVARSQSGYVGGTPPGAGAPGQSIEKIMVASQLFNPREMREVVEIFGAGEDVLAQMPMAEYPEKLATKLLPYQRQALAWLIEKENPRLPPVGSTDVVQLWKRSAPNMFTNIATNFSLKGQDPVLASGGILAVSRNEP